MFKGTKLYSIFSNKCPKCQEGDFFVNKNPYKAGFIKMHDNCQNCHAENFFTHNDRDGHFCACIWQERVGEKTRFQRSVIDNDSRPFMRCASHNRVVRVHLNGMTGYYHLPADIPCAGGEQQGVPRFVCKVNMNMIQTETIFRQVHHRLQ